MSLNADEVRQIAHLARLQISDDAVDAYAGDLNNILVLVEQMDAVDTAGVEPLASPLDAVQRLRADAVTETAPRGAACRPAACRSASSIAARMARQSAR